MRFWVRTFFACSLFFLCCADEVFTTRAFGANLRWGQFLLLIASASLLPHVWGGLKARSPALVQLWPLFAAWGLFFAFYGISVALSEASLQSGIKLIWGVFNILGAATIGLLSPRPSAALRYGFVATCLLIAGVVWIDAIAIYWFESAEPLIGLVQTSYSFGTFRMLRPHAFYYEPSYAGAWLAISVPLVMLALSNRSFGIQVLLSSIPLSAVFLVSARTGLVSASVALILVFATATVRRQWNLVKMVTSTVAFSGLLLFAFFINENAKQYGRFILGPLGITQTMGRLAHTDPPKRPVIEKPATPRESTPTDNAVLDEGLNQNVADTQQPAVAQTTEKSFLSLPSKNTSEGARIASYVVALREWRTSPFFGVGATFGENDDSLLVPVAMSTWFEVLSESGLFGLAAFLLAIGVTIRMTLRNADRMSTTLIIGVWGAHLLVNLNLTQTFPRLDYWLLLFVAFNLVSQKPAHLLDSPPATEPNQTGLTPPTESESTPPRTARTA